MQRVEKCRSNLSLVSDLKPTLKGAHHCEKSTIRIQPRKHHPHNHRGRGREKGGAAGLEHICLGHSVVTVYVFLGRVPLQQWTAGKLLVPLSNLST